MLLLTAPALAASSGQRLWERTYRPASGGASFADVVAGAQGEVYVVGSKHIDQSLALVLLKYDRAGHRKWAHASRGDYRLTTGGAVGLDARGSVYVGGDVYWRSGEGGILLAKYAPDGTRRWSRTWNPMHGTAEWNADILASMAVDRAGNVYLAALSNIGWSDESDGIAIPGLVLANYDARGKRLWAVRYRDASEPIVLGTIPDDLALDGEGNVYLACAGLLLPGLRRNGIHRLDPQVLRRRRVASDETALAMAKLLKEAKTILWNGPVGVFEFPNFRKGTEIVARAIADSEAFSIAGGGDTLAAIDLFGIEDKISYISTGGGAFLEFVEGKALPAVVMLEERAKQ